MTDGTKLMAKIYGTTILVMLLLWLVHSYFEARAYNRITGSDVSTLDAMFLQLRVSETPKR